MENTLRNNSGIGTSEAENTNLDHLANGTSQVGMGVLTTLAALVGIWGAACMVGGIINSSSMMEIAKGFVTAVIGG